MDKVSIVHITGYIRAYLEVLGVSKENGTGNLLADTSVNVGDSGGSESSTLTVSSSNDDSVGAFLVGIVKVANHLSDSSSGGSTRESVLANASSVSTTDTLDPNSISAILGLER